MKFQITLKDPDGVFDSVQDAARQSVGAITGISIDERESLVESRRVELDEKIRKWFQYGEYLTVEIDTDADTIQVKKT